MASDPKVKLLCSFGGKILPRPGDSALRYAGGHTRILSLRRSATLADLLAKIGQILAGPVTVKYQLPDEDLDALISITTDEDLDNMMEEFDRIADAAGPDGSARMRIFLFSQADVDSSSEAAAGGTDTGQTYVDAINGIGLLRRRDSLVSASSSEGMSPSIMSPSQGSINQDLARLGLGLLGDETLASTSVRAVEPLPLPQQQQAQYFNPPPNAVNVVNLPAVQQFGYPIYSSNATLMIPVASNFKPKLEHLVVSGDHVNAVEGNLRPNQGKVEAFVEESVYRSDLSSNNGTVSSGNGNGGNRGFGHQPLSQLPPLHPTHFQQPQSAYMPPLHPYPQPALRLDDCQMCQRALPHSHSDMLITNDHANGNGNGSGSSAIHEVRLVPQSYHSEDPARLQTSLRPESAAVEPKVETAVVAPGQFSREHENERAVHLNMEALDHTKVLHPNGVMGVADPSRLQAPLRVVNGVVADSETKVETLPTGGQFAASGFTDEIVHPHDKERLVHPNVEAFDPAKVLLPHNAVSGALADNMMEPMVDNMSASAQFASYGFTQIPMMPQLHDNDRLLVNPNMPSVVGLPVDLQASYAMVANPSQHYLPDPFQLLLQSMAPNHHLAKQDVATKQNVSVVKNGNYHAGEPPSRVSVPGIPYDYARPINGMMESLRVSTFEPSGITEHQRAAAAVNRGVPMLKPENSTLIVENNHVVRPQVGGNAVFLGNSYFMSEVANKENYARPVHQPPPPSIDLNLEHPPLSADNVQVFRSQAGGNAIYLGNAFIASGIVPEGNSSRPIHQFPPSSLEFTRLQSVQPSETSKASNVMANHGPLISYNQDVRIQPEAPNEWLLAMPTYSCGITPAYNNLNAINVVPVGDQKDEASWFHSNDAVNDAAAPLNSTAPVDYSNYGGSNGHVEQFQGSTPSDSLFCNQDPRKVIGNTQMVPPRINKVPNKEFVAPKDVSTENHSVNIKGSDVAVLAEEIGFHHIQNSTNKDSCTEPVRFIQGEDHSKQEVQGSAEQVVAPVFQPSIPPAPVTFPHERRGADLPSSRESGFGETIAIIQSTTAIADHKIEGVTTKQPDNTNFGFPIKDDIGRLQIIKNSDLEELRELGSGTFGTVYHGKWRGSDVAIKRINDRCFAGKPSEEQRMRDDFWNEACKLADMHHPNVVAFYGVVLDGPGGTVATVTEFMVNGSLRRALQKNDKSLDRRKRLLIAMDVAFGMEYLHVKNIIHFDLKGDNLLVNLRDPQRPICKVADLGLSKVKCQTLISGGVRGTLPWMAPELLNGGSTLVSDKVDVFSFGIVMWELLTGEEPYADLHYGAIIGGIVSNTLRPPVPESCDPEWRSLMEQCWSPEPSQRPNFTEIASRLRSMAASYPQK